MVVLNILLVIAGLYVYLSLFRQTAIRQNGAAVLGDREFGLPGGSRCHRARRLVCAQHPRRLRKSNTQLFRRAISLLLARFPLA